MCPYIVQATTPHGQDQVPCGRQLRSHTNVTVSLVGVLCHSCGTNVVSPIGAPLPRAHWYDPTEASR